MEIMLAIVVVAAVIFFGALISMGNERQRKAIDNLREQIVQWSLQDLRIKHEKLVRDIHIDDPLSWLNKVAGRACGRDLNVQVVESFEYPKLLLCTTGTGDEKIIFTPHSPAEIRSMKQVKHNRLDKYIDRNPLLSLPRNAAQFECSVLNNSMTFDLEFPLAWKGLTGTNGDEMSIMWMYIFS